MKRTWVTGAVFGKAAQRVAAVLTVLLYVWSGAVVVLPVVQEQGRDWVFQAAGITAEPRAPTVLPEPPAAETATPVPGTPQPTAVATPLPEIATVQVLPTPDPQRTIAPVAETYMAGGTDLGGFFVKDVSESGVNLLEELQQAPDVHIRRDGTPVILLYSTHTCESYLPAGTDWYYTDDSFRSEDPEKSIVSVAAEAARVIEQGGFGVIHDTTVFDSPVFTGCYQRSGAMVQEMLEAHPTLQITVDIHRDAFGQEEDGTRFKPVTLHNGSPTAQILIMTGCDLSEDPLFPDWRENLHFALRLQQKADTLFPGVYRPLFFAQRNYNMHATHASLLVEVGTEVNALQEAQRAGRILGETLLALLNDLAE